MMELGWASLKTTADQCLSLSAVASHNRHSSESGIRVGGNLLSREECYECPLVSLLHVMLHPPLHTLSYLFARRRRSSPTLSCRCYVLIAV